MTEEILVEKRCSIEGCGGKYLALGFCNRHYLRFKRHGSPELGGPAHGEAMAWIKAHLGHSGDECLIWPFAKDKTGNARIRHKGRNITAARLMCELVHGAPEPGQTDCAHSCGNGHLACMNPKHLRWATHHENVLDAKAHDTIRRGERHGNAKLTERKVREIRRMCRKNPAIPKSDLAKKYNVHANTIRKLATGEYWSWLRD